MAHEKVILSGKTSPNPSRQSDELEQLKLRLEALEGVGTGAQHHQRDRSTVQRHGWFPWITICVLINFLLWLSMIHAIFEARDYHKHRSRYLAANWLIGFVPLAIAAILLITPFPQNFSSARNAFATRTPSGRYLNVLNILNALA